MPNALSGGIYHHAALGEAHQVFDDTMLSDYLTGVGFAEWKSSEDQWERVVRDGKDRINAHPEDVYSRAMLLWSILRKGNPSQMFEVLNDTAQWLSADLPDASDKNKLEILRRNIERKIVQIKEKSDPNYEFWQWHVEDTLVRAALLRYLRFNAKSSHLMNEFADIGREMEKQPVMKALFDWTKEQRGDSWVDVAVQQVARWASLERGNALARLCLLWFTGRQETKPDRMQFEIEQSSFWLGRNPSQGVVRWATIWLAGLAPRGDQIFQLIEESERWLHEEAADDERLVRHGLLWLVGERGKRAQVQRAIVNTSRWLKAHPTDDFIRVAFLLFLIRRSGTPEERKNAIATTRKWLRSSPDVYGLTDLAVRLCEAAAD